MLLLVLIMAALVLLTLADADLWPQDAPRDYRAMRSRHLPKRLTPRRRKRPAARDRSLFGGHTGGRGELAARWWWE